VREVFALTTIAGSLVWPGRYTPNIGCWDGACGEEQVSATIYESILENCPMRQLLGCQAKMPCRFLLWDYLACRCVSHV
jgi:hypothetical protein